MKLETKAHQLRQTVLEICIKAKTGHVTSCMSCIEIMTVLFYNILEDEDKFILSKGQASPLLYAILADEGTIKEDLLWSFAQTGGVLGVHLDHHIPGAIITAGSLGHGLGISTGMAYARQLTGKHGRIYCLIGDGECYEGSIWEAAMFADNACINNITVILDWNKLMVTERTLMGMLTMKWEAFGWEVTKVKGHDIDELKNALSQRNGRRIIIAETVKGKGIPSMENKIEWHGMAPTTEEDVKLAREGLDGLD